MQIRQVVITEKQHAELQFADLATDLGPHEILVESEASFISAGTELAVYMATENVYTPGSWCEYPCVPGYSNVGRILALGDEVKHLQRGQRIYADAPHASHYRYNLAADQYHSLAVPVPDSLSSDVASALHLAHVAKAALDVAAPPQGRWVAVFGLGMVGNLAAQQFQICGARVLGIDPSLRRRELAAQCCNQTLGGIQTLAGHPEEIQAQILELTQGQGVHTSIDAVGHSAVVLQALKATAMHGEVVLLGSPRVPVQGNLTEVFSEIHLRWKTIKGALEWRIPTYAEAPALSRRSNHDILTAWLEQGKLQLAPLISHRLAPEAIGQAYEGLLNDKDSYTGVIIQWSKPA